MSGLGLGLRLAMDRLGHVTYASWLIEGRRWTSVRDGLREARKTCGSDMPRAGMVRDGK